MTKQKIILVGDTGHATMPAVTIDGAPSRIVVFHGRPFVTTRQLAASSSAATKRI